MVAELVLVFLFFLLTANGWLSRLVLFSSVWFCVWRSLTFAGLDELGYGRGHGGSGHDELGGDVSYGGGKSRGKLALVFVRVGGFLEEDAAEELANVGLKALLEHRVYLVNHDDLRMI